VKAPKVYVRDTGLLHALLSVPDIDALESHPKLGASWESFAIEQVLLQVGSREAYYWRTQAGSELDLLLFLGGKRIGVEVKYGDAPAMTKKKRSEEHTSELQSRSDLVCRLLLEKKKKKQKANDGPQ